MSNYKLRSINSSTTNLFKPKSIRSYLTWLFAAVLIFCAVGFVDTVTGSTRQEITRTEWVSRSSNKGLSTIIFIDVISQSFSFDWAISYYKVERLFSNQITTSLKIYSQRIISYDSLIFVFHSSPSASEDDLLIPRG